MYVSGINGGGIGDNNNVTFYIYRGMYYDPLKTVMMIMKQSYT